jgi:Ca2+-binding EF-hand superfamily protein
MAKIIARGDDLRSLVRTVDRDGDGLVTEEDFRRFLRDARLGLADAQLKELVRHVAFRHGESVHDALRAQPSTSAALKAQPSFAASYARSASEPGVRALRGIRAEEFLGRFVCAQKKVETVAANRTDVVDVATEQHLRQFVAWVMARREKRKLIDIFESFDSDGNGLLEVQEIVEGLMSLKDFQDFKLDGQPCSEEDLQRMVKSVDTSGDGNISYMEFVSFFELYDQDSSQSSELSELVEESITSTLFRHRLALLSICEWLDAAGNKTVRAEEFSTALRALGQVLTKEEQAFSITHMETLVQMISVDGFVDYRQFLLSFRIVDVAKSDGRGNAMVVVSTSDVQNLIQREFSGSGQPG